MAKRKSKKAEPVAAPAPVIKREPDRVAVLEARMDKLVEAISKSKSVKRI